jgi:hypothetical protein
MRDQLAERLLAEVMQWSDEDMARERPILQSMAAYKYDEYQQFIPGMRFVESLALWLGQFSSLEEKKIAYDFVREKVIFCSNAEINHLVEMAYPDFVRPLLLKKTAQIHRLNSWQVQKIAESSEFKIAQRKTLFLGLSDGARIDVFRRQNRELSNEQIYLTYEISRERVSSLLAKLEASLKNLYGRDPQEEEKKFETVVLLDDFSASGVSYIREEESGIFDGKIASFFNNITDPKKDIASLIDITRTDFYIILYVATEQARQNFEVLLPKMWNTSDAKFSTIIVHKLDDKIRVKAESADPFNGLIENYYDDSIETEHTKKGGSDLKFGFNKCGLPLVLSHNTPNNSLSLLWSETGKVRALFPRVSRHK